MPPTQSVNVVASPIFYSSSLESGSQLLPPQHPSDNNNNNNHDVASWASALSSKALSHVAADGPGWVNITLGPVDEATWQEEAHWMSFHHAIQSLVLSSACQKLERSSNDRSAGNSFCSNKSAPRLQQQQRMTSGASPFASPDSLHYESSNKGSDCLTGDSSSLAHSVTRQILAAATTTTTMPPPQLPLETIELSTHNDDDAVAAEKTRLALAQAEQDEWEIMGVPTTP